MLGPIVLSHLLPATWDSSDPSLGTSEFPAFFAGTRTGVSDRNAIRVATLALKLLVFFKRWEDVGKQCEDWGGR